ncbi:hypothetical protein MRX96_016257 [Rhipicephalus microplus]
MSALGSLQASKCESARFPSQFSVTSRNLPPSPSLCVIRTESAEKAERNASTEPSTPRATRRPPPSSNSHEEQGARCSRKREGKSGSEVRTKQNTVKLEKTLLASRKEASRAKRRDLKRGGGCR